MSDDNTSLAQFIIADSQYVRELVANVPDPLMRYALVRQYVWSDLATPVLESFVTLLLDNVVGRRPPLHPAWEPNMREIL